MAWWDTYEKRRCAMRREMVGRRFKSGPDPILHPRGSIVNRYERVYEEVKANIDDRAEWPWVNVWDFRWYCIGLLTGAYLYGDLGHAGYDDLMDYAELAADWNERKRRRGERE